MLAARVLHTYTFSFCLVLSRVTTRRSESIIPLDITETIFYTGLISVHRKIYFVKLLGINVNAFFAGAHLVCYKTHDVQLITVRAQMLQQLTDIRIN